VFWLQSMVRSNQQRETLFELDQSVQALTAELGPSHAEVVRLSGVYHNLIRQWADT
jgi:PKHD-type hydroxylase